MKKWINVVLLFGMILLVGCGTQHRDAQGEYQIYYVDKDETKVKSQMIETEQEDFRDKLQLMFAQLKGQPDLAGYRSAIPEDVTLLSYTYQNNQLILDFDIAYKNQSPAGEVLGRAAIVRTLCQLDEVTYVAFNVEGSPLTNSNGIPVGLMTEEQFVENTGDEINAYEKATLNLYFTDISGTMLVEKTVERIYNSNIPLDKLVVESLIQGPNGEKNIASGNKDYSVYPTIASNVEIVNVSTKDGTCYVNLGTSALAPPNGVIPEVTIYSIVNSLVELPDVNRVKISVNGDSDNKYMETVSLSEALERNMELVEENAQ